MGERIIVRQNSRFETEFLAQTPQEHSLAQEAETPGDMAPVADLRSLTPYGMLLAGLGSCTAVVLHTYAQYHGIGLHQVELRLAYDRVFAQDCKECETQDDYHERIEEEILLEGDLTSQERHKLLAISHHCPIYKMLKQGIEVRSRLIEAAEGG